MVDQNKLIGGAVSLAALSVLILTEPFYQKSLFSYSLTWIAELQKDASSTSKLVWRVYSDAGLFGALAVPVVLQFFWERDRVRAVYLAMCISAFTFAIDLTKLLYGNPRPFWVSDDVQAIACTAQYGHPSGHSMVAVGYSLLYVLDSIETTNATTVVQLLYIAIS